MLGCPGRNAPLPALGLGPVEVIEKLVEKLSFSVNVMRQIFANTSAVNPSLNIVSYPY